MTQRRACFEGLDSEQEFKTMESNPLEQDVEGVEALLEMDVSGDLMNLRLPAGEKPAVPLGADDLVAYYEKQLAATQLVHNRLLKQFNQLAEEKQALETSLTVQTAALQQQLVVAREKSELAYVQTEHAHRQMQETHEAVKEIVGAVTNLTELLDISDDTNELSRCFEVVERNTQRTFQSIATAHETAQTVLELQAQARDACQVSPLFTNASASTLRGTDMLKRLEEDVSRLRRDLGESKRREQELEEEMRAAHQLFSGLEAEVVSLQQDQAQAAAKLQLSQEELVAARDELMATQRALSAAQSPAASALTEGLTKLDAHLASMQSFLEGLAMPQPPGVPDAMGGGPLQEVPSLGSMDGDTGAGMERLKDIISVLQEQLKGKDGELRAARYASLVVHKRVEARSGHTQHGGSDSVQMTSELATGALSESPASSPGNQRGHGGPQVANVLPMPAFSTLLAARAQALQSPTIATSGLSTVQVALVAAEREVLSLRSQLSHRQQHIKLLEQRLLEQSQDIAAMCNRGNALSTSPVGSRKVSFVERGAVHGTEALAPQRAWDFAGDVSSASGNLAEQMRPQVKVEVPPGLKEPSAADMIRKRDETIQQLRAQIDGYRTVLAAAAGRDDVVSDTAHLADYNPRITLEDLPEGAESGGGSSDVSPTVSPTAGYAPAPFRLSSGGPLPFQRADDEVDAVVSMAADQQRCHTDGGEPAVRSDGLWSPSAGNIPSGRQACSSLSTRDYGDVKRQLEETVHLLESSQVQLGRTTNDLAALKALLDGFSRVNPVDAGVPKAPDEFPDQLSFEKLAAGLAAVSGLGISVNQLEDLKSQLGNVLRMLQDSQDRLRAMQMESGAKDTTIARLHEQLQALRGGPGASPIASTAEANASTVLSMRTNSPLQMGAGNPNAADAYTPSLVMNPMFHRERWGSSETAGSDGAQIATTFSMSPAVEGDGPATTVHRNLLFDEDGLRGPKDSAQWHYEQRDSLMSTTTVNNDPAADPDVRRVSAAGQVAPQDGVQRLLVDGAQATGAATPQALLRSGSRLGMSLASPSRLSTASAPLSGAVSPNRSHGGRWAMDEKGEELPGALRSSYAASEVSDMESELSQRVTELEEDIMTERNQFADKLTEQKRAKRDLEARVKLLTAELRLKDEQLAQLQETRGARGRRSSDGLIVQLQQTVANLKAELAMKEESIRAHEERIDDMEQAQALVTRTVSAEVAAYRQQLAEADIELDAMRKWLAEAEGYAQRVKDLEADLQVATERLGVSTSELSATARELQTCARQLTEVQVRASSAETDLTAERTTRQLLEQKLAEAELAVATLQVARQQQDSEGDRVSNSEAAVLLRARVDELKAELEVATQRLDASTRELSIMVVELDASTHHLAEASVVAGAVEANLERERRARQQLQQQLARAAGSPRTGSTAPGRPGECIAEDTSNVRQLEDERIRALYREVAELQLLLRDAIAANTRIQSSLCEQVQLHLAERSAEWTRGELQRQELLAALAETRDSLAEAQERARVLSEASAKAQADRDTALVRADELLAEKQQVQAEARGHVQALQDMSSQTQAELVVALAARDTALARLEVLNAEKLQAQTQARQMLSEAAARAQVEVAAVSAARDAALARVNELLAENQQAQAEARGHQQALSEAAAKTRAELVAALSARDAAVTRVQALLVENDQLQADKERLSHACDEARAQATELQALLASVSAQAKEFQALLADSTEQAELRLEEVRSDAERKQELLLQAEDLAQTLQAQLEEQERHLDASRIAHAGEQQRTASLEVALVMTKSLNSSLWSQLGAVAGTVGMHISQAPTAAEAAQDSVSAMETPSQLNLYEEDDNPRTSPAWTSPLSLNSTLLCRAARAAAAALQSVGDVPMSPPRKPALQHGSSTRTSYSPGTAPAECGSAGTSSWTARAISPLATTIRNSIDSPRNDSKRVTPQKLAMGLSDSPRGAGETGSHSALEQRGLQLLQPDTAAAAHAAGSPVMPLHELDGEADGNDPGGEECTVAVPDVTAAVQAYLDALRMDAAASRERLEAELQEAREQIAAALKQVIDLRGSVVHGEMLNDGAQQETENDTIHRADKAGDLSPGVSLQLQLAEVGRAHHAAIAELEALSVALQQQVEQAKANQKITEEQLTDVHAALEVLQQELSDTKEVIEEAQRRAEESRDAAERELSSVQRQLLTKDEELQTLRIEMAIINELVEDHRRWLEARPSPPVAVVHSAPAGGTASTVVGIQTTLMQCIEAAEQKACAQASRITDLSDRLAEVEGMVAKLEDSLAESNTTVVRLEDAIMECNAEVESLEGWLAESHTTIVRLEDSLAQSKSELKTSTEQEQKLKQLLQATDQKLLEQEQDREGIAQELESLQRRFTELQMDVDRARDDAERVTAQLDAYKAMSREQCGAAERARDEALLASETASLELAAMSGALHAANTETEGHRVRLAAVEVELAKVEEQMYRLQRGVEAQVDELRAEVAAVQYDLTLACDERDDAIRQLNEARDDANVKRDEYQQNLDKGLQELINAGIQQENLLRQLAEASAELMTIRGEREVSLAQAEANLEVMRKQHAELQDQLAALQDELLETVKELANTRDQLQAAISVRDSHRIQLAEAVSAKRTIASELADVQMEVQAAIAAIAERDVKSVELAHAYAAEQEMMSNMTTELAEARKQLQETIVERDGTAAKLADTQDQMKAELSSATAALEHAQQQLQAAMAERDDLASQLADTQYSMDEELSSATAALKDAQEQLQAAVAERDDLAGQLSRLKDAKDAELSSATAALEHAQQQLQAAMEECDAAKNECDLASRQLEELRSEFSALEAETAAMAKKLTEAQEQVQVTCNQRDAVTAKLDEVHSQMAASGQLLASAKEAIEVKRAEHDTAIEMLNEALQDKDSLSSDLTSARSQIGIALNELSDARAQRDAALQQLNAVRDVLAAIEDERSSTVTAAAVTAAVMREHQRTAVAQQRNLDASRASEASRVAEHLRALEHRADDLTRHAEDLQRRLNGAEAHLSSERAEAQAVCTRLELHLASARTELEAMAAERTTALQQLTAAREKCAGYEGKIRILEQHSEVLKGQLSTVKLQLQEAESRAVAERLSAETRQTKAQEAQGKMRAELAAAHAELVAIAAQRDALDAQLSVVLPTLNTARAEQAAGAQQLSNMKGDQALIESHLVPLEEHAKCLQQQAEMLRQQLSMAELRHDTEKAGTHAAISRLETALHAAHEELKASAAARDVLMQQLAQFRLENAEVLGARGALEAQASALQQQVDRQQQHADTLQEQLTGFEARLLAERAEVHSARTQAAAVRAELAAVMAERDALSNQTAVLRVTLASVQSECESAVREHEVTEQVKTSLVEQVRSLEQHIGQLKSQLEGMKQLREQLKDTEVKLASERMSRTAAEGAVSATDGELAAAQSNSGMLQHQLGEVHGQLAVLQKELAAATKELAAQQGLTEARVGEMQAKVAQARMQTSEESSKVQRLKRELAELKTALQDAQRQALHRDCDTKGMVTGLHEALEATRATLEAERARGEHRAKELQDLLHAATTREASAQDRLKQMREELVEARAARKALQVATEADVAMLKDELREARQALQDAQDAAAAHGAELKASVQAAKKTATSAQQRASHADTQAAVARVAEAEAKRSLKEALEEASKQEAETINRVARLEADRAAAQDTIIRLEKRKKDAEDARRNAMEEVDAVNDKLRAERERTSLIEQRMESLAAEVTSLQAELDNARTALSRYEAYAVDAEAEIQELRHAAEVSSEENMRLQQQLDQLVDQLRLQTQQMHAAEEDTAQLRHEVAAIGNNTRRSGSTSRGRSAERRHGSTGRAMMGTRAAGLVPSSILDDPVTAQQQQLLILRKPHVMSRQMHATSGSGPSSALSRTGEVRPRGNSAERRPGQPAAARGGAQEPVGGHTGAPGARPMSPVSLLQKRLTDEATQLRWEVVADSSRVRELQEKRAGGAYLSRAEVGEMELLTARLGAHHARISAIMDTVKLARSQQPPPGVEPLVQGSGTAAVDRRPHIRDHRRPMSPPQPVRDANGKRNAAQQVPSAHRAGNSVSDLELPDQPRQQPAFHPHPPAHPPAPQHGHEAAVAIVAPAVMRPSPPGEIASPEGGGRGLPMGAKLDGPSRMRFYDLETRAEPAELPQVGGKDELASLVRQAVGTPQYVRRDTSRNTGDITPMSHGVFADGEVIEYDGRISTEQLPSGSDSISPQAQGNLHAACPSPSNRSVRSTVATVTMSPWYPPGPSPGRAVSPGAATPSPANLTSSRDGGRVASSGTPGRDRTGLVADTDEGAGGGGGGGGAPAFSGGEALGIGHDASGATRAASRYRTPYLRMLQDMVLLGQPPGGTRGGGAAVGVRRAGGVSEAVRFALGGGGMPGGQHLGGTEGFDAMGHWGSGGGADITQGARSAGGSAGGSLSRGQSPSNETNRPLFMPSGVGPGLRSPI